MKPVAEVFHLLSILLSGISIGAALGNLLRRD